jgi:hypothetical protein
MPAERALFYAGWVFTGLVLLFLIAPILAVIPLSFNAEPYFSYPMPGLSLQWYRDFFGNERWTGALLLSAKLAVTVTILSTVLGTMAALGLARTQLPLRSVILGLLLLPMIVPVIIVAVAVFMFFGYFGLIGTFAGLALAHTALATPFVVEHGHVDADKFRLDPAARRARPWRDSVLHIPEGDPAAHPAGRGHRRALCLHDILRRGRGGVVPGERRTADTAEADVQRHPRDDQPDHHRGGNNSSRVLGLPPRRRRTLRRRSERLRGMTPRELSDSQPQRAKSGSAWKRTRLMLSRCSLPPGVARPSILPERHRPAPAGADADRRHRLGKPV